MRRVLVIGGSGFIGQWIVRRLLDEGCQVTVLQRRPTAEPLRGCVYVTAEGPLSEPQPYLRALRVGRPDQVIHAFAMSGADARAAVSALVGKTGRFVVLSSGDVYLAYSRFIGLEPGPPEPSPLNVENSRLRARLFPYRMGDVEPGTLAYDYEKLLVEQAFRARRDLERVILRLPKVYGPGRERPFEMLRRFAVAPQWRWTHGYVENVAAAITLTATHPAAAGRIFNVGEPVTPTVAERLAHLPAEHAPPVRAQDYDFAQDLVYDTTPIRRELGYVEPVSYEEGLRRLFDQPEAIYRAEAAMAG